MDIYSKILTSNWNVECLFSKRENWLNEIDLVYAELANLEHYLNDIEFDFIKLLDIDNNLRLKVNNIYTYAFLNYLNDTSNLLFINDFNMAEKIDDNYNRQIIYAIESLVNSKCKITDDRLNELNKYVYKYAISEIFKDIKDSKDSNEKLDTCYLRHLSPALSRSVDIYNSLIDSLEEKNFEVTQREDYKIKDDLISISDRREKRIELEKKIYNKYLKYDEVFKEILVSYMLTSVGISRVEGFERTIDFQLYLSDLDKKIYDYTIDIACEGYSLCKEYFNIKKKYYQVDYLALFEIEEPITLISNKHLSYSNTIERLMSALSVLGEEYCSTMIKYLTSERVKISNNSVSNQNMTITSYNSDKVFVTFGNINTIDGQIVVAHEIGHAMYSLFTNNNQIVSYREIPSFLHEIPAMLNELLILDYNFSFAKDVKEKVWYLCKMIEICINGYYISSIYSEFEEEIYSIIEKGEAINTDLLNKTMTEKFNKVYFGIIEDTSILSREWIKVKHYYNSYYIFNYASATAYAIIIYNKLKNDNKYYLKFMQFLKSGKSLSTKDLLQIIDIDIYDKETYRSVNKELEKLIAQFDLLIDQIVKNNYQ